MTRSLLWVWFFFGRVTPRDIPSGKVREGVSPPDTSRDRRGFGERGKKCQSATGLQVHGWGRRGGPQSSGRHGASGGGRERVQAARKGLREEPAPAAAPLAAREAPRPP